MSFCADGSEIKFDIQRVITDGQLKERAGKTFQPSLRDTDSLSPNILCFFHDCPHVVGNPSKLNCLGKGCACLRGLGTGLGFAAHNSVKSLSVTYEQNPFCCACVLKIWDGLLLIELNVCLLGMTYWEPCGAPTCMCNFHFSTLENLSG